MATIRSDVLPVRSKTRLGALARREERLGWALLVPVLIALLAMGVYPAFSTLWYAFQQGGFFGLGTTPAGLANFVRLLHEIGRAHV